MYPSILDVDPAALEGDALTAHVRDLDELHRAVGRAQTAALIEWDRQQAWADDGSLTPGARLARETGVASSTARERMRVIAKLARMPLTRAALDDDRIGWSKVRLLAGACTERTADAFAACEALLVARAEELTVDQLGLFLRHWLRRADADGASAGDDAMHDRQYLRVDESWQGEHFLKGRLDPESGAIVTGAIDAIADELYRAEAAEAKAAADAGDAPASLRSAAERGADALVEMACRAMAATDAAASGSPVVPARALIGVVVDADLYNNLSARLFNGTPLSTADALRWACDAAIFRVVAKGQSVPVDLGHATRTPTEAQRRALATLWATCAHPTCNRPFTWCQIHHIIHWTNGGPTDLANLIPLCRRHHRLHHNGAFTITRHHDGTITFTRPDGTLIGTANPTIAQLLAPLHNDYGPAA